MRRRVRWAGAAMAVAVWAGLAGSVEAQQADFRADSAAALAVFRENIDAIHKRDHPRYLNTYLRTPQLTRGGLRALERGWLSWSARTDTAPAWPDTLIATEMQVAPLAPGVVYGRYRYRGVNKGVASIGISERVFVKTSAGWRIAYTASFPDTLPARE